MKAKVIGAVVAVVLAAGAAVQAAITMETVRVGNAGNTGDMRTQSDGTSGYGAVAYTYNIGKYEVTAGQYTAFLNAVAATDTYGLYNASMDSISYGCQITRHGTSGSYTYDFSGRPSGTEADWANRPVNYVSWGDSVRFANWLTNGQGNGSTETGAYNLNGAITDAALMSVVVPDATQRATWSTGAKPYFLLTSEDEWYKAAYHDETAKLAATYFNYPTNSNTMPSNDLVVPTDPGNNATFYDDNGYTIGSPYYRTEVGAHENSDSPYGTFDQGGNVWEWNEVVIGLSRSMRGGSFTHYNDLNASLRTDFRPAVESYAIGFRVSAVPEPATLSLLALGGLAMIRRRRAR